MSDQDKRLGVYFHIPFCASKCAYCDFCSLPGRDKLMPYYQDALLIQLQETMPRMTDYFIDTVYFGGRHAELLRRAAHRGDIAGAEGHEPADEAERDHRGVQPGQRPAQGAAHAAQGGREPSFHRRAERQRRHSPAHRPPATTGGRWKWRSSARARPASAT